MPQLAANQFFDRKMRNSHDRPFFVINTIKRQSYRVTQITEVAKGSQKV